MVVIVGVIAGGQSVRKSGKRPFDLKIETFRLPVEFGLSPKSWRSEYAWNTIVCIIILQERNAIFAWQLSYLGHGINRKEAT